MSDSSSVLSESIESDESSDSDSSSEGEESSSSDSDSSVDRLSRHSRDEPEPRSLLEDFSIPNSTKSLELLDGILSIPELSKEIWKLLPFQPLLQCSLVNHLWLQSTRDYLRHSTSSSISVAVSDTSNNSLREFVSVMRNCRLFPVSTLKIRVEGRQSGRCHSCRHSTKILSYLRLKLELSTLKKLSVRRLSVVDKKIRHASKCKLYDLLQILIERLSAQDVIHLDAGIHYLSEIFTKGFRLTTTSEPTPLIFHNLQVFNAVTAHLDEPFQCYWGLDALTGKNLNIFNCTAYAPHLEHTTEANSLRLLKYCHLFEKVALEHLEKLAEVKPELISLVLYGARDPYGFRPEATLTLIQVLKDILRSSAQTLVELRTNLPMLNAISQNCNSELTSLKILDLHYEKKEMRMLGKVDFSRNFPNLFTVLIRVHYSHSTEDMVPAIFYDSDYLELVPSVTVRNLIVQLNTVKVRNRMQDLLLSQDSDIALPVADLARAFPQVENVSFHSEAGGSKSKGFKFVSTQNTLVSLMGFPWPELKRLEIVSELPFKDLEHTFLGVNSRELKLWRKLGLTAQAKELQFAPVALSLQNFPKLKLLKFTLSSSAAITRRVPRAVDSSFVYDLEHDSEELTGNRDGTRKEPCSRFWPSSDLSSQDTSGTYLGDCALMSRIPGLEFRYDYR